MAGVQRSMAVAMSDDPALAKLFEAENVAASKESTKRQDAFASLISTPEEKALFDKLGEFRQRYLDKRNAITAAKKADNMEQAKQLFENEFMSALRGYLASVEALSEHQRNAIDEMGKAIDNSAYNGYLFLGVIGLLIAWVLTRSIVHPLARAVQATQAVADGGLTHDVRPEGRDEAA